MIHLYVCYKYESSTTSIYYRCVYKGYLHNRFKNDMMSSLYIYLYKSETADTTSMDYSTARYFVLRGPLGGR